MAESKAPIAVIAAFAVGAEAAYIGTKASFAPECERLATAVDEMTAAGLSADRATVAGLYAQLRSHVDTAAWRAPTRGWTMAQTVAHLDVMTATGLSAVDDAVAGRSPVFDGIAAQPGMQALYWAIGLGLVACGVSLGRADSGAGADPLVPAGHLLPVGGHAGAR